jgi:sec-independent protein translocase protein TatA
MPNVGPLEIAIVLIVLLVIFGPRRLPELGRSAGAGFRELKAALAGSKREEPRPEPLRVEAELDAVDAEEAPAAEAGNGDRARSPSEPA